MLCKLGLSQAADSPHFLYGILNADLLLSEPLKEVSHYFLFDIPAYWF